MALLAALALPLASVAQPRPVVAPPAGLPSAPVIYTLEEIEFGQLTPELRQALGPVHSLQEAEEVLKVRGVSFIWRRAEVASSAMDPGLVQVLASLPPHEPMITPRGERTVMLAVVQQRPAQPPSQLRPSGPRS